MYDAQKAILNSVKLSTQEADRSRLKDPCATLSPSSFTCAHTMITDFSYCSKPSRFFSCTGPSHSVHRIISCLFNVQNYISVYSAIHHLAIDFPAVSYLTPALRDRANFFMGLSPPYVYCENYFNNIYKHHLPMKKGTRIIFISHLRSKAWMTMVTQFKL